MPDERITAIWFTDGWAEAYHRRAKAYGPNIPKGEHRRMMYALKRMYAAQRREDAQRISLGKEAIWFVKAG